MKTQTADSRQQTADGAPEAMAHFGDTLARLFSGMPLLGGATAGGPPAVDAPRHYGATGEQIPTPEPETVEMVEGCAPELHSVRMDEGGHRFTLQRKGGQWHYALPARHKGARVFVHVCPFADEDPTVFLAVANDLQMYVGDGVLLRRPTDTAGAKVAPNEVGHWTKLSAFSAPPNSQLWVKDVYGRYGAAVWHPMGWRVWSGKADPKRLVEWAFMEGED